MPSVYRLVPWDVIPGAKMPYIPLGQQLPGRYCADPVGQSVSHAKQPAHIILHTSLASQFTDTQDIERADVDTDPASLVGDTFCLVDRYGTLVGVKPRGILQFPLLRRLMDALVVVCIAFGFGDRDDIGFDRAFDAGHPPVPPAQYVVAKPVVVVAFRRTDTMIETPSALGAEQRSVRRHVRAVEEGCRFQRSHQLMRIANHHRGVQIVAHLSKSVLRELVFAREQQTAARSARARLRARVSADMQRSGSRAITSNRTGARMVWVEQG